MTHEHNDHPERNEATEIDELRRRIQALQVDVADADKRVRAAVRARPFLALGMAVATGFILGRAIGRS